MYISKVCPKFFTGLSAVGRSYGANTDANNTNTSGVIGVYWYAGGNVAGAMRVDGSNDGVLWTKLFDAVGTAQTGLTGTGGGASIWYFTATAIPPYLRGSMTTPSNSTDATLTGAEIVVFL